MLFFYDVSIKIEHAVLAINKLKERQELKWC
jgi:hypothetical protein